MKTIILCRHAKSDWLSGFTDFDRPLNSRGEKDAPRMGKALQHWGFEPDLILSSPANRALTTAVIVAKELNYPGKNIQTENEIYQASVSILIQILKKLPETKSSVMLFGHNPGIEMTARVLTGMSAGLHVPTSGMVIMETNSNWQDLNAEHFSLKSFLIPSLLS